MIGPTWRLDVGDALTVLRGYADESVQCVVTSPPYYGLRDYNLPPTTWGDGWSGCLGLEPTVLWWLHTPTPPGPAKALDETIIRAINSQRGR